jgi:5'(3')-deoxyribonucleotidase
VKKLIIGFDLDAIIIDLIRPWLNWYNTEHGDCITVDDIKQYKIERFAKKTNTEGIFKFFDEAENYAACPVLPGAAEGLKQLEEQGHDIIITTATSGQTPHLKWHLVKKAAPWLHPDNVMAGARKERLWLDVFVDDAPKNIVKYRNTWPKSQIATISYPYNQDCRSLVNCFAEDHNNTSQAWNQICGFITDLSERW